MHPDLYLRVYQQQERELTQRLANRGAQPDRRQPRPRCAPPAPALPPHDVAHLTP